MTEENKALVSYEAYQEKVMKYREKGYEYVKLLNSYLAEKTSASVMAFIQFCQEPDFLKHYVSCLPELAYAHTFAYITVCEARESKSTLFIQNGNSIEELTKLLKQTEFLLWRLEFEESKETERKFYEHICNYQLSVEVIKAVLEVAAMEQKSSCFTIACIYLEQQRIADAIQILEYGVEKFPEEASFLVVLSQLYRKMGSVEQAEVYEEKIKCVKQ